MSATTPHSSADAALLRARHTEDVVVGDEIVRHRLTSRVIHWSVALLFFVALLSGLPIWTPALGGLAGLFGGLHVCRWLHPWAGVAFFAAASAMFAHWLSDMRLDDTDREWLRPGKALEYMKRTSDDSEVGKYNGGQKLFFHAAFVGAAALLLTGLVAWLPITFPRIVREIAIVLHDLSFIVFVLGIILHIYLGTAAEPGTFRCMVRGTVTRPWARLHHPRWYREITGEQRPPR
jgi:formate dehydrogenase subunit gamma